MLRMARLVKTSDMHKINDDKQRTRLERGLRWMEATTTLDNAIDRGDMISNNEMTSNEQRVVQDLRTARHKNTLNIVYSQYHTKNDT